MAIEATSMELAELLKTLVEKSSPMWLASETGAGRVVAIGTEMGVKAREEKAALDARVAEIMEKF